MADTILELFATQLRSQGHRPALRAKRAGRWTTTTWNEWNCASRALAAMLIARGVRPGDRVAILSNTRQEWVTADLAILMAGAVTVPVYPNLTAEETIFVLESSGAVAMFVDNPQQVEKIARGQTASSLASLHSIVSFDGQFIRQSTTPDSRRSLSSMEVGRMIHIPTDTLADFTTAGQTRLDDPACAKLLDETIASVRPEHLASIVYTAGAVGHPKGVMLTHGNFCFQVRSSRKVLELTAQDEQLLFLPLSHIMGKLLFVIQLEAGGVLTFAENMLRAIDDAADTHPSFFGAVPRVYEKFYAVVEKRAIEEGKVKERLYRWAIDVGQRMARAKRRGLSPSVPLVLEHRYADKIVLSRLRNRFGTRLRFAISGGAPLAAELGEWFDAIGVTVLEGYGLTETTGGANFNSPDRLKFGTVGAPIEGVENAVAPDGEILIRGRNVMQGYWNNPQATAEIIDAEGWLHTGDIGCIDSSGMLKITDRKKDLIVTAAGKTVAPQNIENLLRQSPWINHCVVLGDQRPYLIALITLNRRAVTRWARENDCPSDMEALAVNSEVTAMIQLDVESVNHRLAKFETIKRFHILAYDFSVAEGELTPTGNVRRSIVAKRFSDVIDQLYAVEDVVAPTNRT